MIRKAGLAVLLGVLLAGSGLLAPWAAGQDQVEKAKIFRDTYPLVSDSDYYCTAALLEEIPPLRILSAEGGGEQIMLTDFEQFWAGPGAGVSAGQVLKILEVGDKLSMPSNLGGRGFLAFGRGRARVVRVEGDKFLARIEKACGAVKVGDALAPFETKEPVMGKDAGFKTLFQEGAVTGSFIYLVDQHLQIGSNEWGLIDIGADRGLVVGQQLSVFTPAEKMKPARPKGNAVVIDVRTRSATVKVLSALDAVIVGDLVQVK